MTRRHPAVHRGTGALILVLTGLLGCADSGPTDLTLPLVSMAAKSGGAPPKVNEAVPNEAPQDTSLTVRVIGSGFDHGSKVSFLLGGSSTTKMVVHETRFVSGTDLDADLTVAVDANVALYDIEVVTARGKKGIGTEKFSVKLKGGAPPPDIPVSATFGDAAGDGVLSDGGGTYNAVILEIGNLLLDARVDIPRTLCLDFLSQDQPPAPDDVCDNAYFSTSRPDVQGGLRDMGVGSPMTTSAQLTWVKDGYNWALRFGMDCDLNDVGGRLDVAHADYATWTLAGNTARLCRMPVKGRPRIDDVGEFEMPFQLTIVRQ